MTNRLLEDVLQWYIAAGADEAIGEVPVDRLAVALRPSEPLAPTETATVPTLGEAARPVAAPRPSRSPAAPSQAIMAAQRAASLASNLTELRQAVADFDGCSLKATATNTVFADGNPDSRLMFIGEAPGGDEDRIGRPFVGVSGQLLDRMIATIGLDRTRAYITNVIFWRPPGNRKPTETEVAICRPFVERHIALVDPLAIVIVGGTASAALLPGSAGITKLRGRWLQIEVSGLAHSIPVMAIYHPSFLLRSPERKQETWSDLLNLRSKLEVLK